MADVFVSYSRKDKDRIAPLVEALEARGWSVWWDRAIAPGQEFDSQIAEALASASVVLVVWTADSVHSRWVRGEARDGADRGLLLPVRFGTVALPIDFRAFQTIDLDDGTGVARSQGFAEVARAIEILVAKAAHTREAAPPAPPAPTPAPARAGSVDHAPARDTRVAICVLPFENLGGDPGQDFLGDGITGDVITELSRWRMLSVRPRSATSRYRSGSADLARVARDLDVRYVVEGSVRRIGERIRVTAQLTDTETASQVWAERFDRAQAEFFDVQDELVRRIVGTIAGRVQMSDAERARRKSPASLAAYECVQRGNALSWDEPQGAIEATRLFERAIELDPGYALAHALLGTMRIGQYRNDPAATTACLDEAYSLCKRAVELDDGDSTCHSLLAHACLYRRSYELALQHIQRSVELNPNNAWNQADMGMVLTYTGPAEGAIACLERCRQIDPYFDPPWYWRQAGQAYMALRRYEDALAKFAHVPLRTARCSAYVAACHARLGDPDRAAPYVAECLARNPTFSTRRFMSHEPYRDPAIAEELAGALRLAGLPE